jgi:1-hydroxycarotenoid 3,4-desaturase
MRGPDQRSVAIIGAGIGGLAAAITLAAAGRPVVVLERAPAPGGKVAAAPLGGIAVDAGPGALSLRPVFEALFAAADTTLDRELQLARLPLLGRHLWPDGSLLDLPADPAAAEHAIGAFAGPAGARGYRDFMARAAKCWAALEKPFLTVQRPGALALGAQAGMRGLLGTSPFGTLWDALGEHFADPRLRQVFSRLSTYVGTSPLVAPATLMLVAQVEAGGLWAIEGGMARLPEAMARAAAAKGARFRHGADVAALRVAGGRIAGLTLRDGEAIEAGQVILNADPATLAAGHFGAAAAKAVPAMPAAKRSFSGIAWAMAGRAEGLDLPRLTVFHAADAMAELAALTYRGRMPDQPSVTLWAQGRHGVEPPPEGREGLLALVSAPARADGRRLDPAALATAEAAAFGAMARAGLAITRDATAVMTPADYEALAPGTGGALFGPAVQGWQAIFSRPAARTALPGLFLAGGATHPGAGLAMAAISGRLAAEAAMAERI